MREIRVKVANQTLIRAECLSLLRKVRSELFDVVITSPPYNIGVAYSNHSDSMPESDYDDFLSDVFAQCNRVLRPDGIFFLNVGSPPSNPWLAWNVARLVKAPLQNAITWVKSIAIDKTTYGHFKPVNSKRYLTSTNEMIFQFSKMGDRVLDRIGAGVPFMHAGNIKRFGHKQNLRCRGNSWYIPYSTVSKAKLHPAAFPTALPHMCLLLAGGNDRKLRVLDPFVGSGTTLVACKHANHVGVGIDKDISYLRLAKNRLEE